MVQRWLYRLDELDEVEARVGGDWERVRGLLGGKGANLADMARLGIPVPPGFVVTTEACNAYMALDGVMPEGLWPQVLDAIADLEVATGKRFGDPVAPLLVACRSGAKFSMPGMMDTVLDIGLNEAVVEGMIAATGDERFVLDSHRRLVQMFGAVVLGVPDHAFEEVLRARRTAAGVSSDADLTPADLRSVIAAFLDLVARWSGAPFPSDPREQLRLAVEAVFESWRGRRAHDYREAAGIAHDLGTAVNVITMVFGNLGTNGATGVAMSRDATTGARRLEGDYLRDAQGEDVVAGIRPTRPIAELAADMPGPAAELAAIADRLERHHREMQDMEFTIEDGKLWLLQTRTGKRTAQAAVRIAVDMADEGLISRREAVQRVTPDQVDVFLHPQFAAQALADATPLASGLNVSPGAAVGVAALDPDLAQRWAAEGRDVILVRPDTKPDDVHGMLAARGILTSSGGRTSHAALVARQFGRPAVVGATDVDVDLVARTITVGGVEVAEGDWLSIDGTTGTVYLGRIDTQAPDLDNPALATLLSWADGIRRLGVRANADDAEAAVLARRYGAEGIGLCRTEHMFFAEDRLPIVQRMITAPTSAEQREAIDELYPFQRADFVGLFRAMAGLPVIIRLLDPPLHEFLPSGEALADRAADLRLRLVRGGDLRTVDALAGELAEVKELRTRVDQLRESNPMLGLRGVRLGLRIPDLVRMQTRAIAEAALDVHGEGLVVDAEIMVPLVGFAGEMAASRRIIETELAEVFAARGETLTIRIGTMIEVPRAALTAGAIAQDAEFFSFGTNDLTQMTLGMSRDDVEREFLLRYLDERIVPENPFRSIDAAGVGQLMQMAVSAGRAARPGLPIGICGEHGGDAASIARCHGYGLDYVSCSAYRVPVARLAAAHAALADGGDDPADAS